MTGWEDIAKKDPPKDRSEGILFTDGESFKVMYWSTLVEDWWGDQCEPFTTWYPTHWMLLPPVPMFETEFEEEPHYQMPLLQSMLRIIKNARLK